MEYLPERWGVEKAVVIMSRGGLDLKQQYSTSQGSLKEQS